jgi:ABC-2 type transport system permease protein
MTTPTATLTRIEARLFLRERAGLIWGLGFPPVLLIILGTLGGKKHDKDLDGLTLAGTYVPIVIAFSVAMLALNAMPPVLGSYRERGVLRRMSTTPVPPSRLLAAQVAINLVVAAATTVLVLIIGRVAFDVALPGRQLGGFLLSFALAAAGLFGIGLTIAALAPSGKVANAAGAITFFPMMFFAGLWVPRAVMPDVLRHVSDYTPMGAAVQALQDSARGHFPHALHLAVLAGYAVVFGIAAARLFRWE